MQKKKGDPVTHLSEMLGYVKKELAKRDDLIKRLKLEYSNTLKRSKVLIRQNTVLKREKQLLERKNEALNQQLLTEKRKHKGGEVL